MVNAKRPQLPPKASLFRRADGRLCGMLNLGVRPDGRRDRPSAYGPDEATVAAKLWTLYEQHIRRERAHAPGTLTVADWLEHWLTEVHAHAVDAGTLYQDASAVRRYHGQLLGSLRLAALTPRHCQHALHQLAVRGLAPSTIGRAHTLFRQALKHAVAQRLLAHNPSDGCKPPRIPRAERPAWTLAEARVIWRAIRGHPLEALWTLALTTFLREAELLGLQWGDVDLSRGVLTLRRRLRRVQGQGWDLGPTKTAATARTVALTPPARAALQRHKVAQARARLQAGPLWQEQGLIFPNAKGGPRYGYAVLRQWYQLQEDAGVQTRLTLHQIRHTAATRLMNDLRASPRVAAAALGHAGTTTTMSVYAQASPGETAAALAEWAALLEEEG